MEQELKYYGVNACRALWRARPKSIVRAYVTKERLPHFSDMLRWCAGEKKAYHVVSEQDLRKITESVHHEGVCVLAKSPQSPAFADLCKELAADQERAECILFLDGVHNPHNLGALARVAAFFGCRYILGEAEELPALSPSACRMAEGGIEFVRFIAVEQLKLSLKALKKLGFEVIAAAAHDGRPLFPSGLSKRAVIILGNEVSGLSRRAEEFADRLITIPGSGCVESLNVTNAGAVLLSDHWRQYRVGHVS